MERANLPCRLRWCTPGRKLTYCRPITLRLLMHSIRGTMLSGCCT
jgi:hypothetical protein